jgi:L,D-transpeptidase catalytic domain
VPRRTSLLLVVVAIACGSPSPPPAVTDAPDAAPPSPPDAAVVPPPYGPEVRSLRLKRSIVVRLDPRQDAKALGTVAQDTRVGYSRAAVGDTTCPRWIEIEPRGWVCERYLEPSKKEPAGVELPKLKEGEIVPGVYGKVVKDGTKVYRSVDDVRRGKPVRTLAGSVTIRRMAEVDAAGRRFWKTESGELIEASAVSVHKPSTFAGLWLDRPDAPPLPVAWTRPRKATVRAEATKTAAVVKTLPPRTLLTHVGESSPDGAWLRLGDKEWIARADLHLAVLAPPPPHTGGDERWLDVDLDEQIVIAYEGKRPVYVTLGSTGNPKWPTAPGIYRVWIKFAETTMNGQMGDEQPYSVATVPWTMFFAKDLAFHTAYWHDRFGEARSHGCINLSPVDARALYFWAAPDVPLGWSMAHGIVERPGSLVRIRSAAVPEPEFLGYAKRVQDARTGATEPAAD